MLDFVISDLNLKNCNEIILRRLQVFIASLASKFNEKWVKAGKRLDSFSRKNEGWLDEIVQFPNEIGIYSEIHAGPIEEVGLSVPSTSRGRPIRDFEVSSERSKKRKIKNIVKKQSSGEIMLAAEISLRSSGKRDAATIVKELSEASPSRATKIKRARKLFEEKPKQINPEQALAYYVSTGLTKSQYILTHSIAKDMDSNLFPPYHILLKAKKECYPTENDIFVNEGCAEIRLQAILDHTVQRLIKVQEEVLNTSFELLDGMSFTLVNKWGCDGSAGHSQYKQIFVDDSYTDEYMFVISFVPIQLFTVFSGERKIIWQNPRISSTKFCRPIKLMFAKESTALINEEVKKIQDQISSLQPTLVKMGTREISVTHNLLLTMIDGKVCNALASNVSPQKCYLCGVSPKDMNSDKCLTRKVDPEKYSFGISSLHAWIRFFECLLHISYRLNIKKWQIRGEHDKTVVEERKREIQKQFKRRMGLIVDKPKPGFGSTNDGNTARRFFCNEEESATITGIDKNLIHRFHIILQTISCGYDINVDIFKVYVDVTRKLYISLYPWYFMPASIHKILVHGPEIISHFMLPIGQLSEEAQEARNKDCRNYRENHTRKMSRVLTNRDILSMLLITSNPLISSLKKPTHKSGTMLSQEAINILTNPSLIHESEQIESVCE